MQAMIREQLVSALLQCPSLIDLYQKREPLFASRVIAWLSEVEKVLQQFRLPLAALVASERGRILAAGDGYRDLQVQGERLSPRKAGLATAFLALSRVQEELRRVIGEIDGKFELWREKIAQFLAVVTQKIPIPLPPGEPRPAWLGQVWTEMGASEETQGMYRYLNAAMPASDRLYLLEEVVGNLLGG